MTSIFSVTSPTPPGRLAQNQEFRKVTIVKDVLADILKEVDQLSLPEKAELADLLAECLGSEIPPEVERCQLDLVQQRVAEVGSGAVELIPGRAALAQVREAISPMAQ